MPYRILHIYHDFHPTRGGIEDYLAELSAAQARQPAIEPVVLCANAGPTTRVDWLDGVRVVRAAAFGRYFTPFCPGWPLWLRRLQPDLVHLHLPCPLGEWTLALARPAVPLVVSLHNDYVRPRAVLKLHWPLHRRLLRRADAILASSPDYARTSPALAGLGARVWIVPYGIDGQRYSPPAPASPGEGVLSAGRLCYYKGIEVLLAAAPGIAAPITILGDGPWRPRLQAQARRMRLNEQVRFLGAVSEEELLTWLHRSALFVFPSTARSEAFGLAQLKAMAAGLPVVSSDLPGVSWLNRHGESGLTVPVGDSDALAAAVNRLLADPALHRRLGRGAKERATLFDVAAMCEATARVYDALLSPA